MELGPKSLQLGPTWGDRGVRVAARAVRRRDHAALPALERSARAATDRASGGALATMRGANQRYFMRKPEARHRIGASPGAALHARAHAALTRRRCWWAAARTSRRWTWT